MPVYVSRFEQPPQHRRDTKLSRASVWHREDEEQHPFPWAPIASWAWRGDIGRDEASSLVHAKSVVSSPDLS